MRQMITTWLNKISMYRLLSIALSLLWGNALLFSLLGIIEYHPLALVLSGLILITTTTLSNRLFGRLFGVRTHEESSYITALILFFILPPSLTPSDLLLLSLVGVIASGSKYILALRGRHIFNPAAIGTLIAGIAGLAYATWWVGTPPLLPATLLLAFIILYRTGRLLMGMTFLAFAIPAVLLVLLSYHTPIRQTIPLLASWPLLFFAGFMLSEPLTQPPKTWQQLVEASVVGVLFALPLQIGVFAINPVAALLVGNLIAFIFSRRRQISLTLKKVTTLTSTTNEYVFRPDRNISYEPGQYMEITLPHAHKDSRGIRRTFSLTSSPGDKDIKFGIKFYDQSSSFKQALAMLPIGTPIQGTRVGGDFILPKDPSVPLIFIAGGIGITPFVSHLASLQKSHKPRDIVIIYIVKNANELAYRDILRAAKARVIVIAPSGKANLPDNWEYIQASSASSEMIKTYMSDVNQRHAYIAGPPQMVIAMKKNLKKLNVSRVTTDSFTGY